MFGLLVGGGLAALLTAGYVQDWLRWRGRPVLRRAAAPEQPPLISVLIPARNEERAIGRCVAAALAQRYPRLEVLVLDDGSSDGTADILARFDDPRLRVLRGRPLPAGWTGKCNACQQLGEAAAGEWLLFLDADTAAEPDLAASLLAHVSSRGLALLSLFPFLELGTFWERIVLPVFMALIEALYPPRRLERPTARPSEVMANGPCLLVSREAYLAIGGHGAVRGEVLEDVRFAQAIRAAGFRVGVADGAELLRVRLYRSGAEVVAGLGKHAAAGYRSGGARSFWVMLRLLGLAFGPLWLLAAGARALARSGRAGGRLLGLGAATLALGLASWGRRFRAHGLSPAYAPLWPLGLLGYLLIALRGMLRVWSGRGVVWKGRRYQG